MAVAKRYDVGRGDDLWTIREIAIEAGCSESTVGKRIAYGVTGADLLQKPQDHRHRQQVIRKSVLAHRELSEGRKKRGNPRGFAMGSRTYDVGSGRRLTQKQIAAEAGVSIATVSKRLCYGLKGDALLMRLPKARGMADLIAGSRAEPAP